MHRTIRLMGYIGLSGIRLSGYRTIGLTVGVRTMD